MCKKNIEYVNKSANPNEQKGKYKKPSDRMGDAQDLV